MRLVIVLGGGRSTVHFAVEVFNPHRFLHIARHAVVLDTLFKRINSILSQILIKFRPFVEIGADAIIGGNGSVVFLEGP